MTTLEFPCYNMLTKTKSKILIRWRIQDLEIGMNYELFQVFFFLVFSYSHFALLLLSPSIFCRSYENKNEILYHCCFTRIQVHICCIPILLKVLNNFAQLVWMFYLKDFSFRFCLWCCLMMRFLVRNRKVCHSFNILFFHVRKWNLQMIFSSFFFNFFLSIKCSIPIESQSLKVIEANWPIYIEFSLNKWLRPIFALVLLKEF